MSEPFWDTDQLKSIALDLGDKVVGASVSSKDGSLLWPELSSATRGTEAKVVVRGPHLYSGTIGIAMFLAALKKVTAMSRYGQACLRAIEPIREKFSRFVRDPDSAKMRKFGMGGLVGLGGFIYAFTKIGEWLDLEDLVEEARDIVALCTSQRIDEDSVLDVVGGSAGAILSLLALDRVAYRSQRDSAVLEVANACAHHLLATRRAPQGRFLAWETIVGRPPLSGFAHGTAGICYSLLKLYEVNGDPSILNSCREALNYERSLFSAAHKNWLDMRYNDRRFMVSWCHGAPGIALARLGSLKFFDDGKVGQEIEDGLDTTSQFPLLDIDHICCGNMGRVEVLVYAYQKLNASKYLVVAHSLARQVLARSVKNGGFLWRLDQSGKCFDPSLFTGASGVGYGLLRLAYPDQLPCLLLMD